MTKEEAIAYGKRVIDLGFKDETAEFCEMAISALSVPEIDNAVSKNCKNLSESYGEICVKCNKCGRFDKHIGKAESEGE